MQGTGLGMAIARNIVNLMNGDIQVESAPNKGTKITVTVYLKLQAVSYTHLYNLRGEMIYAPAGTYHDFVEQVAAKYKTLEPLDALAALILSLIHI